MNKQPSRICLLTIAVLVSLASPDIFAKGGFVELPLNFDENSNLITNPWRAQPVGTRYVYIEEDDDECIVGIVDVKATIDQFKTEVNGVRIREIHDREFIDTVGECDADTADIDEWDLLETTLDWYAQDVDGNVWYFGEHTIAFDHDECDRTSDAADPPFFVEGCLDGSWEAGVDVAGTGVDPSEVLEGIVMLAEPQKGQFYFQEYYEDEATDMGKVLNFKKVDTFLYDEQEDCLVIKEWVPLSPGEVEHKYYCYDKGLVLVEGNAGGPTVWAELVEVVD